MKKYILSLLVALLAGFSTNAWAQTLKPPPPINPTITNIWGNVKKLDTGRHSAASFVIDSTLYIVTGDTTSWFFRGRLVPALWAYDTTTNSWTRKAPFPGKLRIGAVGFSINGKGYIGGGRNFSKPDSLGNSIYLQGDSFTVVSMAPKTWDRQDITLTYTNAKGDSLLNDFWEYDPSTDKWTQKADIPGTVMGRAYAVGFSFGNKGYVGLGYDNKKITGALGGTTSTTLGPYIDSIVHTQIDSGPPPKFKIDTIMRQITKVEIDSIFTDDIEFKKDIWEYNPGTNTWTQKANFPGQPRAYSTSFVLFDKACVGLGIGDSIPNAMYDDFYAYTPPSNTWKRIEDFPASKRFGAGGWGIAFLGYVINGNDGLDRKDFYEYNDKSETWDRLPNKPDSARSLGIGEMIGRLGIYGTGAGIKESYENLFKWLVDTNRVFISNITYAPSFFPVDSVCAGETFFVTIKKPFGYKVDTTVFTAELSDTSGSFFYPVVFDSTKIFDKFTDSIRLKVTIPYTTVSGNKYKIRVNASTPNFPSPIEVRGNPTKTQIFVRRQTRISFNPTQQTSCIGADAIFKVTVPLDTTFKDTAYYTWRRNGVALTDPVKYIGIHDDSLIIKNVALSDDASEYDVIVNGYCISDTSSKAKLIVQNIPPANITIQPETDTVCEGSLKNFGLAANGTAINYRWIKGKDTLYNSPFITGTNTSVLSINPTRLRDSGWYRALVFENCGSKTFSDSFYLAFYLNTQIINQPINMDTVEFVNAGFKVKAQGKNLKYQWYKDTVKLSNGAKFDGVNTDSLTIKNTLKGDVGFYQCIVTGDCGTPQKSLLGLLEIDPSPVITEQPVNTSDCEKSTVFFSVKVDGANITYQWRKDGVPITPGPKYSGIDTRTLVITGIDLSDNGDYDCEVSTGPFTKVISSAGKLTVKPIPPKPVVKSFGPDYIQSSVSGDIYRWYLDNIFVPTLTQQTINVKPFGVGDYRVRVTLDGCISELSDPYFWFPTTGIADVNAGNIKLYPNPATDNVDVEIPSGISQGTVKVYDMVGKVVLSTSFASTETFTLNISSLREGMYFVTVSSNNNTYVGRLVKE